jgi:hypothetical protein
MDKAAQNLASTFQKAVQSKKMPNLRKFSQSGRSG